MSFQSWVETLGVASTDGPALTNTITATSLLPPPAKVVLPAQFFDRAGKTLRIKAFGRISTVVTTPGTFAFDVRFGSIAVFACGAMNLNATAQTNASFTFEALLVCRAIGNGTTATVFGGGSFESRAVVGSPAATVGSAGRIVLNETAPTVGAGFDSTTAQTVDLFGTWSIANAANSIQIHHYLIESVN